MFNVYAAGPIQGLSYDGASNWRIELAKTFSLCYGSSVRLVSPMRDKTELKHVQKLSPPYADASPLCSAQAIVTRDLNDVRRADLILACWPTPELPISLGTGFELGYAVANNKPIVAWVHAEHVLFGHPFLTGNGIPVLSDLDEVINLIASIFNI